MKPRTKRSPVVQFKSKLAEPQFGAPQRISKEQLAPVQLELNENGEQLERLFGPLCRVSLDDKTIKLSEQHVETFFGPLVKVQL